MKLAQATATDNSAQIKFCGRCKTEKSITEFRVRNSQKGTFNSWCRSCSSAYSKERYQTNDKSKEGKKAAHRKWAKKNPEYQRKRYWENPKRHFGAYLKRKYKLSLESYRALVEAQGGICKICQRIPQKSLCVDHNHVNGNVRGLLCDLCNRGLGYFGDSPEVLRLAAEYLERASNESEN